MNPTDTDTPNMNDKAHDIKEWWVAKEKEFEARSERLDAETRMKYTDTFSNFGQQFQNFADWTAEGAKEKKAEFDAWWNEMEVKGDEAI